MSDEYTDTSLIYCSKCGRAVSDSIFNIALPVPCENCGAELQVTVFPAMAKEQGPVELGDSLQTDDEASCFYHPHKKAVVACESCGRFLCSLCEISMAGRRLCPNCLEIGRSQERMEELITHRTLYDRIALSVALWPLLMVFITILTAPMAIYISIRHWKSAPSIVPGWRKARFTCAILIALLELGGWAAVLSPSIRALTHRF
jgi:hypothetical protein